MGHRLEATTRDTSGEGAEASAEAERAAEVAALQRRHVDIERRLTELGRHLSLTSSEQHEWTRLKKEKLAGKDRLAVLAARARRPDGGTVA